MSKLTNRISFASIIDIMFIIVIDYLAKKKVLDKSFTLNCNEWDLDTFNVK